MQALQAFNDNLNCQKCGSIETELRYRPSLDRDPRPPKSRLSELEHLHVTCENCGVTYAMACKDAERADAVTASAAAASQAVTVAAIGMVEANSDGGDDGLQTRAIAERQLHQAVDELHQAAPVELAAELAASIARVNAMRPYVKSAAEFRRSPPPARND
jgi:hypothetical protein